MIVKKEKFTAFLTEKDLQTVCRTTNLKRWFLLEYSGNGFLTTECSSPADLERFAAVMELDRDELERRIVRALARSGEARGIRCEDGVVAPAKAVLEAVKGLCARVFRPDK